jgi:hypothetical protein
MAQPALENRKIPNSIDRQKYARYKYTKINDCIAVLLAIQVGKLTKQ